MPVQGIEALEQLKERGRKQGFLTDNDLKEALKQHDRTDEEAFVAFRKVIEASGITVVSADPVVEERVVEDFEPTRELEESTQAWLRRAGRLSLLTHEQEIALARRMENPRSKRDAENAKNELIMANLRLVANIARRYLAHGMPIEDLMQEGTIGLIRAVERFNYRKGFRFSTYAIWWIRRAISRSIADQGRLIRLPVHVTDTLGRINKVRMTMRERLGRMPTRSELAEAMDMSEDRLAELIRGAVEPMSLETPIGDEGESTLGDLIPATDAQNPALAANQSALREEIASALNELTTREKEVIVLRYGLGGDEAKTLEEVGNALEVTRERVRQIETSALAKLRRRGRSRPLRELIS